MNVLRLSSVPWRAFVVVLQPHAPLFAARKYRVVGGQHVSFAPFEVWKAALKCGKGVPDWLSHVMVQVIVIAH